MVVYIIDVFTHFIGAIKESHCSYGPMNYDQLLQILLSFGFSKAVILSQGAMVSWGALSNF